MSCTGLDVRGSSVALAGAAADAITDPLETQFLRDAAALGLKTVNGQAMTLGQFERLREFLDA
ncbi:MAG: hypothetical protein ACT6RL_01745 [Neoaquamicrobium sediminum]|uniref:hypothetical protein n=1 Tax=Neoaquamicrobium sediminum TaxID=1849104 RepID=UPI0040356398